MKQREAAFDRVIFNVLRLQHHSGIHGWFEGALLLSFNYILLRFWLYCVA
jgi:hypothetical protein